MLKTRHIFLLFVPAILLVSFVFYINIIRYEPLYPKETKKTSAEEQAVFIPILPEDPIAGSFQAPKTIIAFEDLACPGCKQQADMLEQLLEEHPDKFKIIWKTLSVNQFPYSTKTAHTYAYCAHEQGMFIPFTKLAFANLHNLSPAILKMLVGKIGINEQAFETCLSSENASSYLETNEQIARSLNIQSVPTFFVDNEQIQTPLFLEGWKTILEL